MSTQTLPVGIDLMRTLDEKHMASSIAFESMHTAAVFVLDGSGLFTPDGGVDRDRVVSLLAGAIVRAPEMSKRLMHSPLGITTPAWVPDDGFDVSDHIVFSPEAQELSPASILRLTGLERPPLRTDRPLWDMTVTPLTGEHRGDVAVGVRLHHVVGDAKWAFNTLTLITDPSPESPAAPPAPATRAPRTPLLVPLHAARAWLAAQPSVAAGWREYWRKPFLKRARRMGGRNIRPLQEWTIRRNGLRAVYLPPTTVTFFSADASAAARVAAKLRGSLNDLLVAAAMRAVDDDDRGIDVLVPVSRRARGDRQVRNHVQMTRAHAEPGTTIAELVPEIRRQVTAFARNLDAEPLPVGRGVGYATIVPWADHVRFLGGAEIKSLTVVPATDRRDELSVFAAAYNGVLTVTVTGRAELDILGCADRVQHTLDGRRAESEEAA